MKVLYVYKPLNSADTSLTVTSSPTLAQFQTSNLLNIRPSFTCKTLNTAGTKFFKFDAGFGNTFNINSLFLNRFNFANFNIQGSDDDFITTPFDQAVIGCTLDELYDPNDSEIVSDKYMHIWSDLIAFNYRYLRIWIPAQTPLFNVSSFQVGNILFGNCIEIWNPRAGFAVTPTPNLNANEFDSGFQTLYKKGKSFRTFDGTWDKFAIAEFKKIVCSYNPIVLYLDWTSDPQQAFLVRSNKDNRRSYEMATTVSVDFMFRELV